MNYSASETSLLQAQCDFFAVWVYPASLGPRDWPKVWSQDQNHKSQHPITLAAAESNDGGRGRKKTIVYTLKTHGQVHHKWLALIGMFACRWGLILASQGWNPATSMVDVLKEVWFGKLIVTLTDMRWWIIVLHLFQQAIARVHEECFPIWSWVIWDSHPCFWKTFVLESRDIVYHRVSVFVSL